MFDIKEHLRSLSETHAPSGYEHPVQALLADAWSEWVTETDRDGLGSFIGIKRATLPNPHGRRIMLAAHMDEIAMIVRDVVDGFLFVTSVAGMDNRLQLAQTVIVHGKRPLKGVVAATPPHLLTAEARKAYPTFEQLVIDVGLPADEVSALVQVGTLITPDAPVRELLGGLMIGKAFDDRACVAIMSQTLYHLQGMSHSWDLYATATVQEENGLFGALTAAQHIAPDVAIALDVTFAPQSGVPVDAAREIGGGPVIALGVNFHPKLFDLLVACAAKHEIKTQIEALPGASGTDAWAIQTAREGIPTALISLPIRNMHSPNETLDPKDMERCARLLAHFIAELNDATLDTLALGIG